MTIKQRTKNMNKLIKFLRKYPHSFNMNWVGTILTKLDDNKLAFSRIIPTENLYAVISNNEWGAACCIIGYTNAVSDARNEDRGVADFLGIGSNIAHQLCYPEVGTRFYPELTYQTTDVEVAIKFIKQVCEEQNDLQRVRSANSRRT
jgi:hypothetical protein